MSQDLRSYLDLIKQNHSEDFLIVSREVDPAFEITAIAVKLEQEAKRRPILLFEKVKGTKYPVLTNLHAGRSRLAAAISAKPEEIQRAYLRAMEKPILPRVVSTAPVKEVILTGEKIASFALHKLQRFAKQAAHDRPLVLIDGADRKTAQRNGRMNPDSKSHRQRFIARFGGALKFP